MTTLVTTDMPMIGEAARKRRPWLAPFRFAGRIGRKRYWTATLGYLLGGVLGLAIWLALAIVNYNPPQEVTTRVMIGFVLLGISGVAMIVGIVVGLVSTGIRRLHDRGKRGWWLILSITARRNGCSPAAPRSGIAGTTAWSSSRCSVSRCWPAD
jgi:uncharacterized membrane protein YhaH (DUF805 family)